MSALDEGRLAEIEAAARAATPGPWIAAEQTHGEWFGIQSRAFALGTAFDASDAAHIAAASPDTVLALVAEVREARAMRERVEALADEWRNADEWTRCVCGNCCADDLTRALTDAESDAGTEVAPADPDDARGRQIGAQSLADATGRAKDAAERRLGR